MITPEPTEVGTSPKNLPKTKAQKLMHATILRPVDLIKQIKSWIRQNPKEFSDISSGIQNGIISLAVIIGAIWTAYTFASLRQKTRAQAEITELEQKTRLQAIIEVRVAACQKSLPGDSAIYVQGFAEVKNVGTRNATIRYEESGPFTIAQVAIDQQGKINLTQSIRVGVPTGDAGTTLRTGATQRIPFFARVGNPGLYLITFETETTKEENIVAEEAGKPPAAIATWSGSFFLIAQEGGLSQPKNSSKDDC